MTIEQTVAKTPHATHKRSRTWVGPLVAGAVGLLLLVWAGGSGFKQDLLILFAVYALIALGMYIPFVMAGSLSMAYAAYAAIGGYSVAIISTKTDIPVIVAWIIGPVISAIVAIILSMLTRRLSGFYLAAVTLLFSQAFEPWLIEAHELTGGSSGIGGIPQAVFFGWAPPRIVLIGAALVLVVVVAWLIERVRTGSWGVTVRTMRDVPSAVEAMGVKVTTMTTVTLAVGAAIASWAGAIFASFVLSITPETFTLSIVFMAIFMPLIGGQGSAWGAVLGALLVVQLTLNMPGFEGSGQLVLAIAVLLILLVAPSGLIGYARKLTQSVRNRRSAKEGAHDGE